MEDDDTRHSVRVPCGDDQVEGISLGQPPFRVLLLEGWSNRLDEAGVARVLVLAGPENDESKKHACPGHGQASAESDDEPATVGRSGGCSTLLGASGPRASSM